MTDMKNVKEKIISNEFTDKYPNIAEWVEDGILEIGCGEYGDSFIRVLDEGGVVWEGRHKYPTLDDALQDAEKAIEKWFGENG